MKQSVISFFQNLPKLPEEQYNEAMALYRKSPGKSIASESYYNRAGYTSGTLENLFYDLKKLHGISEVEIRETKVVKLKKEDLKEPKAPVDTKETVFNKAPEEVKAGAKLRDIFPSIEKEDYPDKLKVLVTDKVTAYHKFVDAHQELFKHVVTPEEFIEVPTKSELKKLKRDELDEALKDFELNPDDYSNKDMASQAIVEKAESQKAAQDAENGKELTPEEIFKLAKKAVENFELDAAITEELRYYEENGEILGNHPIFEEDMLKETINAMSTQDLIKRRNNLRSYISKETKKMEKADDEEKKQGFADKIKEFEEELDLISAKLESDAKK